MCSPLHPREWEVVRLLVPVDWPERRSTRRFPRARTTTPCCSFSATRRISRKGEISVRGRVLPLTLAHATSLAMLGCRAACLPGSGHTTGGLRLLLCDRNRLCAVQPWHFPRRALRLDPCLQIHFADG